MAFNLEKMTVDYKSLMGLIPTERLQLAQSGQINDLISALTPGQLLNMFPRYYREQLPDVGQINQYAPSLDVALSGGIKYKQNVPGKDFYSPIYPEVTKTQTPEDKAIRELFEKAGLNQAATGPTAAITDRNGRIISTAATGLSPQERALLDTIAIGNPNKEGFWESPDYNTIVGQGGKFESFADHPRVFGTRESTAAGRYQFTKTTWDDVVTRFNKKNPDSPIADFSPVNQDRAALFLASEDYRRRTGRDLQADLDNPPSNMGELIKYGLGGAGNNTTWQIFQYKKAQEIQEAFETNYERNVGRVKEIEAAAEQVNDLEQVITKFDPSMIGQLDQRLQTWYENASEIQKKKFQTAIEKLGVDQFNETMKRQPITTATLQAVESDKFSVLGGSIEGVDPRLVNVVKASSNDLPEGYTVKMISGYDARSTGTKNHPNGLAMDVQIYDNEGNLIPHNKNSAGWKEYEKLYRSVNIRGKDMYPDQEFIWGGAWISEAAGRGDPMHYQIVNRDIVGTSKSSGKYSFESGLDPSHPFVAEGGQLTAEERVDYDASIRQRIQNEKVLAQKKAKEKAEAIAQADPVSATQNQIETANSAPPALATGGTIPPGENIAGVNMDTGKIEFMANDRERIRVDPATLENVQQPTTVMPEDTARLQAPVEPQESRRPQVVPQDASNPALFENMVVGYTAMPPSQVRATNRAKLYGEDSAGVVNGHFA